MTEKQQAKKLVLDMAENQVWSKSDKSVFDQIKRSILQAEKVCDYILNADTHRLTYWVGVKKEVSKFDIVKYLNEK